MVRYTRVPWGDLEPSDVCGAHSGLMMRDTRYYGAAQRQYALTVTGSIDQSLVLGMVAIRCNRNGPLIEPLTLSIP